MIKEPPSLAECIQTTKIEKEAQDREGIREEN